MGGDRIYFADIRTMKQVAVIGQRVYHFRPDFSVAPDGSKILFSQLDVQNIDLMMVRAFR